MNFFLYSKIFLLLLIAGLLSACMSTGSAIRAKNREIQAIINSQNFEIPKNAIVTLSITQNKADDENYASSLEYNFIVESPTNNIPFKFMLPQSFATNSKRLYISARVEYNKELILMSSKIIALPSNTNEKLILTVKN